MGKVAINRVTNANCYIEGSSQLGKVEEATLPDIEAIMAEHKALGMVGQTELPAGLQKMSAKLKFSSFYRDVLAAAGNVFRSLQLQLRASVETYDGSGRTKEVPLVVTLTGTFKKLPLGTFKQHESVTLDTELNVTAVKFVIDGQTTLELDVLANIYKVNGVDQLATFRTNIGG